MIYLYLLTYFKLKRNKIRGYIFYNANKLRNKELKTMNDLLNLYEIGLSELVYTIYICTSRLATEQ